MSLLVRRGRSPLRSGVERSTEEMRCVKRGVGWLGVDCSEGFLLSLCFLLSLVVVLDGRNWNHMYPPFCTVLAIPFPSLIPRGKAEGSTNKTKQGTKRDHARKSDLPTPRPSKKNTLTPPSPSSPSSSSP